MAMGDPKVIHLCRSSPCSDKGDCLLHAASFCMLSPDAVVDLSEVIGAGPTGAVGQSAHTLWQLLTATFRAVELVLKARGAEPHSTAGVPAGGASQPARKAVDIHPDS